MAPLANHTESTMLTRGNMTLEVSTWSTGNHLLPAELQVQVPVARVPLTLQYPHIHLYWCYERVTWTIK